MNQQEIQALAAALAAELKKHGRNELPPQQLREYRRKKAVQMKAEGYSISYIAQHLNASLGTIVRDLKKSQIPVKTP